MAIQASRERLQGAPDRRRPFDGQPHTFGGQRGQAPVLSGLNLRDIHDMVLLAIRQSTLPEDHMDQDTDAIAQNACCNIEALMGIYPNLAKTEQGYRDPAEAVE